LAEESAARRKLLHEVQDLRGSVRVYCRARPPKNAAAGIISFPSQDTLVLNRQNASSDKEISGPISFEFDRVFDFDTDQLDVYTEVEEVCLGALDGYSVCLMCYGQTGSGKTHTVLGDINVLQDKVDITSPGIQLKAMRQLFEIANERCERYEDKFMLTIVEVYNDRLCDLLAGTEAGEGRGEMVMTESKVRKKGQKPSDDETSSGRQTKLEICTDLHGDTVVQGLLSIPLESFADFHSIWEDCLKMRLQRLRELDLDIASYESSTHVITTLYIYSTNIATGSGSRGKLQFVDLAGSDLVPQQAGSSSKMVDNSFLASIGLKNELRFSNRSLEILGEVVEARLQFSRSVPYHNSTLTHLLRDSLEADTKVLFMACVSSDEGDWQETLTALRFASRIRRVIIGKATKHILSPP